MLNEPLNLSPDAQDKLDEIKGAAALIFTLFDSLKLSNSTGFVVLIYALALTIVVAPDRRAKRLTLAIEVLKQQVAAISRDKEDDTGLGA